MDEIEEFFNYVSDQSIQPDHVEWLRDWINDYKEIM